MVVTLYKVIMTAKISSRLFNTLLKILKCLLMGIQFLFIIMILDNLSKQRHFLWVTKDTFEKKKGQLKLYCKRPVINYKKIEVLSYEGRSYSYTPLPHRIKSYPPGRTDLVTGDFPEILSCISYSTRVVYYQENSCSGRQ